MVGKQLEISVRRRRRRSLGGWRRLKTGSWQYRVRGVSPNGQPFYLQRVCEEAQKTELEAEMVILAERYRSGLALPRQKITLSAWVSRCKRSGIRWTPQDNSTYKLLRYLYPFELSAIDHDAISRWTARVLFRGEGKAPRGKGSAGYIRHAFELLRRLLYRATQTGRPSILDRMPWGDRTPSCIPTYTKAHKKRSPIADSDIAKIVRSAKLLEPGPYIRVILSLETGARPHELARARREWLLPSESMHITGIPAGTAVLRLPSAKGGLAHDVPVSAAAYSEYLRYESQLPEPAKLTGLLSPVCHRGKWQKIRYWIHPSTWRKILRAAGLPSEENILVPYQLRHTKLASIANNPLLGPRTAQAIAGHVDVRTTESYCGRARSLLPDAFFSPFSITEGICGKSTEKPEDVGDLPENLDPEPIHVIPRTPEIEPTAVPPEDRYLLSIKSLTEEVRGLKQALFSKSVIIRPMTQFCEGGKGEKVAFSAEISRKRRRAVLT